MEVRKYKISSKILSKTGNAYLVSTIEESKDRWETRAFLINDKKKDVEWFPIGLPEVCKSRDEAIDSHSRICKKLKKS